MNWLRSLLWVPMVFGLILGGLSFAKIWADGVGIVFVGAPEIIIHSYQRLANLISFISIEYWFDIELSRLGKNIFFAWIIFSASNIRAFILSREVRFVGRAFPIPLHEGPYEHFLWGAFYTSTFFYFIILGPLLVPLISFRLIVELLNTAKDTMMSNSDRHWIQKDLWDILYLYMFIVTLNPLIAILLLWWNESEIDRLTSSVG